MAAMTLLITGAGGFVGRHAVAAALARGHKVRALLRNDRGDWAGLKDVDCVIADLADPTAAATLAQALTGVDAVIHAAAAMSGDAALAARDTLAATAGLIAAMQATRPAPPRLVLVSSIAVYDADALPEGAPLDETAALEHDPASRDGYARAKLAQEATVQGAGLSGWIARPGAVFGPGRVWNAHLGPRLGPVLIRLGNDGQIPLIEVKSCAEALIRAAETAPPQPGLCPVNLVDDDLPDRQRFLLAMGDAAPRLILPLSWRLLERLARALKRTLPGIAPRLPGLLRPRVLHARMRPQTYDNSRAKTALGWQPRQPFETALAAALKDRA